MGGKGDVPGELWKKRRQRGRKPKKRSRSLTNTVGDKTSVPRRIAERQAPLSFVTVPPRRRVRFPKMYIFQDNLTDRELPEELRSQKKKKHRKSGKNEFPGKVCKCTGGQECPTLRRPVDQPTPKQPIRHQPKDKEHKKVSSPCSRCVPALSNGCSMRSRTLKWMFDAFPYSEMDTECVPAL